MKSSGSSRQRALRRALSKASDAVAPDGAATMGAGSMAKPYRLGPCARNTFNPEGLCMQPGSPRPAGLPWVEDPKMTQTPSGVLAYHVELGWCRLAHYF